ncbi:MAG: hypothetical protein O2856_10220 [Planctomycetota bacterium]|nr:hypothetical protein [Planctomycetota bacterium]
MQEFIAIAPDLVMRDGRVEFWKPLSVQGEFKVLPKGPVAAESPTFRLVQMKDLANRFELSTDVGKEKPERYSLRMLPRPIYRYGQPDSQITDGAVFMWSRGTDPDAILLIELHSVDGKTEWHYGIFPVSIHPLSATMNDEIVWEKPRVNGFNDRSGPHFAGPYRRSPSDPPIKPLLP